jgi:hypothetical protein
MWKIPFSRALIAVLLAFIQSTAASAQLPPAQPNAPPLSAAADRIRSQVENLPVGGRLTVNMLDGNQYCGNLHSIEAGSFSIREVDLKKVLTLRYEEVQRIRKDYGRKGFGGRRVHPRTNRIAALVILGGLLVLVIALVAADKS